MTYITNTNKQQAYAIVVGLCAHGLALVRGLARNGIPVIAVESNRELAGYGTRYAEHHWIHDINGVDLVSSLIHLAFAKQFTEKPVLILTNDHMVRTIGRYWPDLEPFYRMSWGTGCTDVLRLLDKNAIEAVCRREGLAYPVSRTVESFAALEEQSGALSYPALVKPVRPLSRFKAARFENEADLIEFLRRYTNEFPVLIQQWIPGGDEQLFFCALYLESGQARAAFAGRKVESLPRAMGQTTIAESIALVDDLEEPTRRFFRGTEISGPVSVEYKCDENGTLWVIEPTVGRTDYWADCCIAAGFNLPLMEYREVCGHAIPQSSYKSDITWYDTERDFTAYYRHVWRSRRLFPTGSPPVFPYLGQHDWLPLSKAVSKRARLIRDALVRRGVVLIERLGLRRRMPTPSVDH